MTPALLPPDPTRQAWYWVQWRGCSIAAVWVPTMERWYKLQDGAALDASKAASRGYTLASPRPIPTAAQLDALWELVETLEDKANDSVISPSDAHFVGPVTYTASGRRVEALRESSDLLRAALKGDAT